MHLDSWNPGKVLNKQKNHDFDFNNQEFKFQKKKKIQPDKIHPVVAKWPVKYE